MSNPPRTYSIKVPTKTYLRKYIQAMYTPELRLTFTTRIGTFLICLIEREYYDLNISEEATQIRLSYMQDEVEFFAPLSMKFNGHSIPPDKIIAINRYFEDLFVDDLFKFVKSNIRDRSWRPGIAAAIECFADKCAIEIPEDITLDALKKAYQRHKSKEEKKFQNFVLQQNRPSGMLFGLDFSNAAYA